MQIGHDGHVFVVHRRSVGILQRLEFIQVHYKCRNAYLNRQMCGHAINVYKNHQELYNALNLSKFEDYMISTTLP